MEKSKGAEGVGAGIGGMNFDIPWNMVKEHQLHNFMKYFLLKNQKMKNEIKIWIVNCIIENSAIFNSIKSGVYKTFTR